MSDMEEVLLEHLRTGITGCRCGWADLGRSHTGHLAAALSAAGFGPVQEAQEAAWAQGFASGKSRALRAMSDEPHLSLYVPNPYREASNDGQ